MGTFWKKTRECMGRKVILALSVYIPRCCWVCTYTAIAYYPWWIASYLAVVCMYVRLCTMLVREQRVVISEAGKQQQHWCTIPHFPFLSFFLSLSSSCCCCWCWCCLTNCAAEQEALYIVQQRRFLFFPLCSRHGLLVVYEREAILFFLSVRRTLFKIDSNRLLQVGALMGQVATRWPQ